MNKTNCLLLYSSLIPSSLISQTLVLPQPTQANRQRHLFTSRKMLRILGGFSQYLRSIINFTAETRLSSATLKVATAP